MAKKNSNLRKGEEEYIISVLKSILKFGFTKKDIKDTLKKL